MQKLAIGRTRTVLSIGCGSAFSVGGAGKGRVELVKEVVKHGEERTEEVESERDKKGNIPTDQCHQVHRCAILEMLASDPGPPAKSSGVHTCVSETGGNWWKIFGDFFFRQSLLVAQIFCPSAAAMTL